jgi:hypothetical protein
MNTIKKDRMVLLAPFSHAISGSLQGHQLNLEKNNPSPLPTNSRVGYFLWLNESTDTINPANAIAIIKVSNTVMAPPPFYRK